MNLFVFNGLNVETSTYDYTYYNSEYHAKVYPMHSVQIISSYF